MNERVLTFAAPGADRAPLERLAGGGAMKLLSCGSLEELLSELDQGAEVVVLAEAGAELASTEALLALPQGARPGAEHAIVALTGAPIRSNARKEALLELCARRGVVLLEPPVHGLALQSTVRSALLMARRRRELRERSERLAQEVGRRDQFLAVLGHELRSPLGAIRNCLELQRLGDALSSEDARFTFATLDRQVHLLTRHIDEVLELARATQGRLTLERQAVELASIVDRSMASLCALAEQRSVVLSRAPMGVALPVHVDPARIGQLVDILLGTALRNSPAGSRVLVAARALDGFVELSVRDAGADLATSRLERVFEPFHQDALEEGGPLGGLAVARCVAELHGGRLWAQRPGAGHGTEFVLRLPRLEGRAGNSRELPQEAARQNGGPPRRVLIIEDHPEHARTLTLVVEAMGHDVRTVHRGDAGVSLAREWQPEVVLLDLDLPDMDGCEVARRLREELRAHEPVLVAVTGRGLDGDRERTRESGCRAHLTKPVTPDQLRSVFRLALPD